MNIGCCNKKISAINMPTDKLTIDTHDSVIDKFMQR